MEQGVAPRGILRGRSGSSSPPRGFVAVVVVVVAVAAVAAVVAVAAAAERTAGVAVVDTAL